MPKQNKPKFKTEVMKTRTLHDSKQTTLKLTTSKPFFEIDDVYGLLNQFESTARQNNQNIQTMIRIPTLLGPRTVKMFSGDLKLQEYEDYFEGRVSESGKFKQITYLEIIVIKQN